MKKKALALFFSLSVRFFLFLQNQKMMKIIPNIQLGMS